MCIYIWGGGSLGSNVGGSIILHLHNFTVRVHGAYGEKCDSKEREEVADVLRNWRFELLVLTERKMKEKLQ